MIFISCFFFKTFSNKKIGSTVRNKKETKDTFLHKFINVLVIPPHTYNPASKQIEKQPDVNSLYKNLFKSHFLRHTQSFIFFPTSENFGFEKQLIENSGLTIAVIKCKRKSRFICIFTTSIQLRINISDLVLCMASFHCFSSKSNRPFAFYRNTLLIVRGYCSTSINM